MFDNHPFFLACTSQDKHAEVATLEQLIKNGEIVFIEKKDPVSLSPNIIFLNDLVYATQTQQQIYAEKNTNADEKTVAGTTIKTHFSLKNIMNGKTYIIETVDPKSPVVINDKNDIIVNGMKLLAPGYTSKSKEDTVVAKPITAITTEEKLRELNQFDESVIHKWTNTGRLGNLHEIFYYEIDGKKFKSASTCYLIKGQYFYNVKLGILKLK